MLLRPEHILTPITAKIRVKPSECRIIVVFPEQHKVFNDYVKHLGYTWNAPARTWERSILPAFHGPVDDRAVELVHTLLGAGFLLDIEGIDATRVQDGSFEPEHTRWIKAKIKGAYTGWFFFSWARSDDLYHHIRKLHGSRYDAPGVVVPPDSFREVQDCAEALGFRFSVAAQQIVNDAQQRYEAAIMIVPKRTATRAAPSVGQTIIVHDIAPNLRDDDV